MSDLPLHARPDVHERRWFLLGVLCLSLVMIVMAVSSLNVALPTLQSELDTSATMLQWIVDSYALVFAGLLLTAGALGDRFGRKGALLVGLAVFAAGALISGLASSAELVIVGRAVQGAGAALVMPATLSLITAVFPPEERQRAIAIWVGFAGAGGALGPIVSGALLEHFWWGSAFLVNIPVVALTAAGRRRLQPALARRRGHAARPAGRRAVARRPRRAAVRHHRGPGARLDERHRARHVRRRRRRSSSASSAGSASPPTRCCRCRTSPTAGSASAARSSRRRSSSCSASSSSSRCTSSSPAGTRRSTPGWPRCRSPSRSCSCRRAAPRWPSASAAAGRSPSASRSSAVGMARHELHRRRHAVPRARRRHGAALGRHGRRRGAGDRRHHERRAAGQGRRRVGGQRHHA